MVKPDATARGLTDKIQDRIIKSGLKIVEGKYQNITLDEAKKLYKVHESKPFYNGLVKFITSGPVYLMRVEGENAVSKLREVMGETDPRKASLGTIRADFKEENIFNEDGIIKNLVHGSDSQENAKYEMGIFFNNNSH